jgi:hypothetical protein
MAHTQLKIYDMPEKLVLVVNATEEEERVFTEEVGMRLKAVGFETNEAQRYVQLLLSRIQRDGVGGKGE